MVRLMDKTDLPVVAIDEMNKTHAREADMINNLFELVGNRLTGQENHTELGEAIEEFAAHVEQHFSREEQLMQEYGFPAHSVHKAEHDRVRIELLGVFEDWRKAGDATSLYDYLKNIHPGWAKNHIATMDMMTAMFISKAGGGS